MQNFIRLVTSSQIFAFFFILAFLLVIIAAVLTENNSLFVKLGWSMLALLGVFITITAFVSHAEARQSKRWPKVSAKLLSTGIRSSLGSGDGSNYTPVASYEYSYLGNDYTGSTIDFSASSGSENWAKKVIQQLEDKGIALTANVNPQNPEMSVLNPGVRLVHYLRYLIGPAMVIIGVLAALDIIHFK